MTQSGNAANIPNRSIARSVFRWIHLIFSIPILGYIYSPFEKIPQYAPLTRFVFVPVMILSGMWMWKGHVRSRADFEKLGEGQRCSHDALIQLRVQTMFRKA